MNDGVPGSEPVFSAEVRSNATGETYGVGVPGGITYAGISIEGDQEAVLANPAKYWCELVFDLPVLLGLGDEAWEVPFGDTQLRVRIRRARRGQEIWSSTNTTTLPFFSRVTIRASPVFEPDRTQSVAEAVLESIDYFLDVTGQPLLKRQHREGLTLRAAYYLKPYRQSRPTVTATVPILGVIESLLPDPAPLTPAIVARVQQAKRDLTELIARGVQGKSFTAKVIKSVHDFSFYCRQHPATLGLLHEEQLRDLLLIAQQHAFHAEGEAMQRFGKTDIKIVNPDNRYEIAVVELKIWKREASIEELLQQSLSDHVTGQEALIVMQVFSSNSDFQRVAEKICGIVSAHPDITAPLTRAIFEGSPELLFQSTARVRDVDVPLLLSLVDIRSRRV
ncbi:hypothetical protein [Streptomyces sp. CC219B]|uniref:hypothetical protein n=1 Tax=Streptomyces sp. CC219B TaxID=3044574 RepID=UPI0024A81D1F|nr:hypothetical protein [Streptomyces sp. CC219B]